MFLGLDAEGGGIITVVRTWSGGGVPAPCPETEALKSRVENALPPENVIQLEVDYKSGGIDIESRSHEAYLTKFRDRVFNRLQDLVNSSVEKDPEIKSRKKMVQEVYAESLAHLALLREVKPTEENDESILRIKTRLLAGAALN